MLSVWMASVCVCVTECTQSLMSLPVRCARARWSVSVCVCVSTSAALVRGVQTAQLVRD